MHRTGLMLMLIAVAVMLALPACSNRRGSAMDPSGSGNAGGNGTMGGSGY